MSELTGIVQAQACVDNSGVVASGNLWSDKVCVAAALVSYEFIGPHIVAGAASCKNPDGIKDTQSLPNLDYNVNTRVAFLRRFRALTCTLARRCTPTLSATARGRRVAAPSRSRTSSTASISESSSLVL